MSSIQNQNGNLIGALKPQGVLKGVISKPLIVGDDLAPQLPAVTEEDNDKVLAVEEGKWVKKHLPVDEELSKTSVNAVQNKVVTAKFAEVETTIGNIDALLGTL